MLSATRSKGRARPKTFKGKVPERVYSAAEVADALRVSKMTVLRYIDDGDLPRPSLFLQYQGHRVWLWNAGEFDRSLDLLRGNKRVRPRRRRFD
jgi:hypothetical protein